MARMYYSVLTSLCLTIAAVAAPWSFTMPLEVTAAPGKQVLHHLESAGRKNIAARGGTVAVTWEDRIPALRWTSSATCTWCGLTN